jgi:hypothetical protein
MLYFGKVPGVKAYPVDSGSKTLTIKLRTKAKARALAAALNRYARSDAQGPVCICAHKKNGGNAYVSVVEGT